MSNRVNINFVHIKLLAILASLVLGCAKQKGANNNNDAAGADDSIENMVESTVGSVNGVANDVEQVTSYARFETPKTWSDSIQAAVLPEALAASCGMGRYSPAFGVTNCQGTENDQTVQSSFGGCTVGKSDEFTLNGTMKLSFDQPSTCDEWINGGGLPTSGSLLRTSQNFYRLNPNGSRVELSSDLHRNYLGENISGGVKTNFLSASRSVDIFGLHRVRKSQSGLTVFDHSVRTQAPVVFTGSRATNDRTIVSGVVRVDHNLAKYSSQVDMSGLSWSNSCCYPSSGKLNFTLTGSVSGQLSADFGTGTCGDVSVTVGKETRVVQLAVCE